MKRSVARRARALLLAALRRPAEERATFLADVDATEPIALARARELLRDDAESLAGTVLTTGCPPEFERRAAALFDAALDLAGEECAAFLESSAVPEPAAVARAEELLGTQDGLLGDIEVAPADSPVSTFLRGAYESARRRGEIAWVPPSFRDALVGDRFRMGVLIGQGRFGAVYLARDELLDVDVAVKVLLGEDAVTDMAAPRERIALLALDVPDVVRLIDFGTFEGRPYLVTEYFEGDPFPGPARRGDWRALAGPVVALLEALSRVHGSGVIHGDLKPANVLVNDDGQLRLVDLGVAVGRAVTHREGVADAWGGTLPFLAPELCREGSEGPTVQSDLFAVGVMIYHALVGAYPQLDGNEPPATDAERDAFMRRRAEEPIDLAPLRDVDLPAIVRQVLASLLAFDPRRRPDSAADAAARLRGIRPPVQAVEARVTELSGARTPLSEKDLRALFAGPERLFQVPRDAAALVWSRTGGDPAAVIEELSLWVRGGFARVREGLLVLDRAALGRVEALAPPDGPSLRDPSILASATDEKLLDLIAAAGPNATVRLLADAAERSYDSVDGDVRRLVDVGVVQRLESGTLRALFTAPGWGEGNRREAAHVRIAAVLPEGAQGRLRHLVGAHLYDRVAADAATGARELRDLGDVERSRALLVTALAVVRAARRPGEDEATLVRGMFETGLAASSRPALRLALHEAQRSSSAGVELGALLPLTRAAVAGILGDGRGAILLADSAVIDPRDVLLQFSRHSVRAFAADYLPAEEAHAIVRAACAWSLPHREHPRVSVGTRLWDSTLLYRLGRYSESLAASRAAQRSARSPRERLASLMSSVRAGLEAYELDAVEDDALQARDVARTAREPLSEARAEYYARAARYRDEREPAPDPELLDAARHLRDPITLAFLTVLEAAIHWRRGDEERARRIALESVAAWRAVGLRGFADLPEALAAACGDTESAVSRSAAFERAFASDTPGISLQVIALHALGRGDGNPVDVERVRELARRLPDAPVDRRREILSIEECLRFVVG